MPRGHNVSTCTTPKYLACIERKPEPAQRQEIADFFSHIDDYPLSMVVEWLAEVRQMIHINVDDRIGKCSTPVCSPHRC